MKKKRRSKRRRRSASGVLLLIVLLLVAGIGVVLARMLLSPKEGPAAVSPIETELPLPQVTTSLQTPSVVVTERPEKEDPESILYQYLYEQVDGQQQVVNFTAEDMSMEQIGQVLEQLQRQPEFFWLEGYELVGSGTEYQVKFDWKYTDLTTRREQVEQAAAQALAAIPKGAGDYETALSLHDWLCDHIVYQSSSDGSDQDLYGALVNGRCVCSGYSQAYVYLLRRAGIQAETVRGTADNGTGAQSHAWTKVVLDGEVYYTDVTWDDQETHPDGHTYSWFAVTSERMASTHFAEPERGAEMTPSSAVACNYHYRNGWVLEQFNTEELVRIFSSQTGGSLTVLAADEAVYGQLMELVQDGEAMTAVLEQAGYLVSQYTYFHSEGSLCLDLFPDA